jgi:hypothetical protein
MAIRRRSKVLQRADKRSLVRTLSFVGMVGVSAQSIGDQTELANGALRFLLRTIDLSANAGKVRREWPSRC